MQLDLARVADAFRGSRATVVGDPLLDVYIDGCVERLCREAPIPLVRVERVREVPGGAANVACNLSALGAQVRLLGAIGDDPEGLRLCELLEAAGVDVSGMLAVPRRRTVCKHRLLADGQMLARFDRGEGGTYPPAGSPPRRDDLRHAFARADVVVVSDYGYGTIDPSTVTALAGARPRSAPLVADSRAPRRLAPLRPTAVKPSYEEARRLVGAADATAPESRARWVEANAAAILEMTAAHIAAVTLDRDGAVVLQRGRAPYRTYARPARGSRSTGGGDTFIAAFALALAAGADTPEAAELASAAAAVVTGKDGTAVCSARELREMIAGEEKRMSDLDALAERVASVRAAGSRIVFTNGCFDILHRGHVTLLNRAKALGDFLVVGVNSDVSVRRLKGAGRPINALEDRLKVLAALSYVDALLAFDAESPRDIIARLRPDVYVKGGDYTRATLPECGLVESLGGAVCLLPLVEDRSTTHLIDRIRGVA